jgi:tRNA(fMet)-specific endonuclease VapC
MLDTNICSFIMRRNPPQVLQRLQQAAEAGNRLVISSITYAELRYGAASPKAPKTVSAWIDALLQRLDEVLPWDIDAVDASANLTRQLLDAGTPIGPNDTGIAGHALATGSVIVTNNTREFRRVPGLLIEDWSNDQPT